MVAKSSAAPDAFWACPPQERSALIVAAACDLFYELGYAGASLDAVAKRLGVSKPVLYESFANKEKLLVAVCRSGLEEIMAAVRHGLANDLPYLKRLDAMTDALVDRNSRHYRALSVYVAESKHLSPAEARRFALLRRNAETGLIAFLRAGHEAGAFDVENAAHMVPAIMGVIYWSVLGAKSLGAETSPDQVRDLVRRIVGARPARRGRARDA